MQALTERCPYCDRSIAGPQVQEIRAKIREEERRRQAQAEAAMQKRFDERLQRDLQSQTRAIEAQAKAEAQKQVAVVTVEHNKTLRRLRVLEAREATIRKQAQEQADRAIKKTMEEAANQNKNELDEQRQVLEKDRDHQLLRQAAQFNRERERYQKKTKELERQLQKQSASELGDGAEIDLLEAIRDAFPGDRITRIKKGEPGADIVHKVVYKGDVCGKIVYDSKNRQGWQSAFAKKLHEDQVEEQADHGILSTTVFPSGKKALCIEEGVIVASPALVVRIVRLLRSAMIRMHTLGLSMKERAGKMAQLYRFMTSEAYTQRFGEATKLTGDIQELDVEEVKEHQRVWKCRGQLTTRLTNVLRELDSEISGIVENTATASVEAGSRVTASSGAM